MHYLQFDIYSSFLIFGNLEHRLQYNLFVELSREIYQNEVEFTKNNQ